MMNKLKLVYVSDINQWKDSNIIIGTELDKTENVPIRKGTGKWAVILKEPKKKIVIVQITKQLENYNCEVQDNNGRWFRGLEIDPYNLEEDQC